MLLGAHISVSGGVDNAVSRGYRIGCTAIQIFTKNNNQWHARDLREEEIKRFLANRRNLNINPVIAHDAYLINLAANKKEILEKSREAFLVEMERCEILEIPFLVMHPGAHLGAGEHEGLKMLIESFTVLEEQSRNFKVIICIETTAGQGTALGHKFEHIAVIIEGLENSERFACCFDTCHSFAAGYDLRTEKSYYETMEEFDKIIGLEKLKVFHLNDSKKPLGSRVDRHEHIGKGFLGLEPFRLIMNDERFCKIPKIIETPKGPDMKEDVENLKLLKSMKEFHPNASEQ